MWWKLSDELVWLDLKLDSRSRSYCHSDWRWANRVQDGDSDDNSHSQYLFITHRHPYEERYKIRGKEVSSPEEYGPGLRKGSGTVFTFIFGF